MTATYKGATARVGVTEQEWRTYLALCALRGVSVTEALSDHVRSEIASVETKTLGQLASDVQ